MKIGYIYDEKINQDLVYWVGENAQDNWDMIDKSDQNNVWFHLDGHPSAHVILRIDFDKKKLLKQTLLQCAVQCKINSKFVNQTSNKQKIKIVYTEIRNISKADKIGSVNLKKKNYLLI